MIRPRAYPSPVSDEPEPKPDLLTLLQQQQTAIAPEPRRGRRGDIESRRNRRRARR